MSSKESVLQLLGTDPLGYDQCLDLELEYSKVKKAPINWKKWNDSDSIKIVEVELYCFRHTSDAKENGGVGMFDVGGGVALPLFLVQIFQFFGCSPN